MDTHGLWTEADDREAMAAGFTFQKIFSYPPSSSVPTPREVSPIKWRLEYTDKGHSWGWTITQFVEARAVARLQPFEKAWTFYCFLALNDMLVKSPPIPRCHKAIDPTATMV